MNGKQIALRVLTRLGVMMGLIFAVAGLCLGLQAVIYLPIGFLFGVSERVSYFTLSDKLENLFWHVWPGLGIVGLACLLQFLGFLLLWVSRHGWRDTSGPETGS